MHGHGTFCRVTINRARCSPSWNTRGTSGTNCTQYDKFVPCSGRSSNLPPPSLPPVSLFFDAARIVPRTYLSLSLSPPSPPPRSCAQECSGIKRAGYIQTIHAYLTRALPRNIVPLYYIPDFRIGTAESSRPLPSVTGEEYR